MSRHAEAGRAAGRVHSPTLRCPMIARAADMLREAAVDGLVGEDPPAGWHA